MDPRYSDMMPAASAGDGAGDEIHTVTYTVTSQ